MGTALFRDGAGGIGDGRRGIGDHIVNGAQIAPDQIREDRRLALLAGLLGCVLRMQNLVQPRRVRGRRRGRGDSVRKLELRDGQGGDVRPGLVAQAREQLALFGLGQQHRQEHQVR